MRHIVLIISGATIRKERSAESFGPDHLNTGATNCSDFGLTLSETMNYASYIIAFQLCLILGFSSCCCQSTVLAEIQNLKKYLNATGSDVADGGPLFLDILKNWKEESDKKIIQSQIVSFYFKIFKNLEGNRIIQKSMETLREDLYVKFFNSNSSKRDDFLKVMQTPVNDRNVQRKAISELHKVIDDLSPKSNQRKRKRRQNLFRGQRASE
ncbi:interferon gamma [Trichechus manatus latirostris]|uniref:Interferon gamma n=1 Tax=Trichechus manatus latirostris TaxID=127582 RepID=A0A2Y9E5B3_TRIMA|nr:interferon gamma [Trichechus manatus latirostris]